MLAAQKKDSVHLKRTSLAPVRFTVRTPPAVNGEVLEDPCQMGGGEPSDGSLGASIPLDSLRSLRSRPTLAPLGTLAALDALLPLRSSRTLAPLRTLRA